jgi:hypothetical protein
MVAFESYPDRYSRDTVKLNNDKLTLGYFGDFFTNPDMLD